MNALLRLDNASRTHGEGAARVLALDEVSLAVQPGEFVALMGPSGSGKSTLLHLAGGLDTPTSGTVEVDGKDLAGLSQKERAAVRRSAVGYVFQDYNLIPALSAVENVSLPCELDGMSRSAAAAAAMGALDRVGLADVADRYPDELSGGQRQRISIARGIVGERRIILADEPTGALDTAAGEAILALLRGLCDDGAAVVLVTHEARHAAWADRVIYLRDGRIVDQAAFASLDTPVLSRSLGDLQ